MSLTGALYNAFSGLTANSRAASVVATNIANATTEGYGRREVLLSPGLAGTSGGVRFDGIARYMDAALVADRWVSDAETAFSADIQSQVSRIEGLIGPSGDPFSLTGRVTAFENALVTAANNPASPQRLEAVATTANALATTFNTLSTEIQASRQVADQTIASQVDALNTGLHRIDALNENIAEAWSAGTDTSSMLDERQRLIDNISAIVPLRSAMRERGEIALFTQGGAALLDGRAYEVGFSTSNSIDASMSLEGGQLGGLTLNGVDIGTGDGRLMSGGSLAAQFRIRDTVATDQQARLDGIARGLAESLGAGGPDGTLLPGDPGLFTDGNSAFDASNEIGFAGRIQLNSLVSPGSSELWRLRDGLGAAAQGEVGDARLLQGVSATLISATVPASANLPSVARSFVDLVSDYSSSISGSRVRADADLSFHNNRNTALRERELAGGVDTDQELQSLMKIEQFYKANAQVMSTVDELMDRLMAI